MTDIPNECQVGEQPTTHEVLLETGNSPPLEIVPNCNQTPTQLVDPVKEDNTKDSPLDRIVSSECNHQDSSGNEKNLNSITTTTRINATVGYSISQVNIEQQLLKAKRDLESMVLKYAKSERENLQNKQKAEELDKKLKRAIKDNDQLANRIKLLTNDKNQLTDTLNAKVAQLTVLEQKNSYLNNVQGVKLKEYEEKIKKLEITNEELLTLIESYKSKEGELLDFSERLSMKHMMLQSELDEALKKIPNYKDQYEETLRERSELIQEKDDLTKQLKSMVDTLKIEQDRLGNVRNEMKENELNYRRNLDQLQNEIKVIRRKHQIATKELMKEIKQLKERLEKFDQSTTTTTITTATQSSTLII